MNQLCKVCGEPAAGFHFGAFTCEGCKSFFGRTYNNVSGVSECKNGGRCEINKKNRTSCKSCRLRKCLQVGMSKSGSRYGRRSNWFKIHCLLSAQQNQQNGMSSLPETNNNSSSMNNNNNSSKESPNNSISKNISSHGGLAHGHSGSEPDRERNSHNHRENRERSSSTSHHRLSSQNNGSSNNSPVPPTLGNLASMSPESKEHFLSSLNRKMLTPELYDYFRAANLTGLPVHGVPGLSALGKSFYPDENGEERTSRSPGSLESPHSDVSVEDNKSGTNIPVFGMPPGSPMEMKPNDLLSFDLLTRDLMKLGYDPLRLWPAMLQSPAGLQFNPYRFMFPGFPQPGAPGFPCSPNPAGLLPNGLFGGPPSTIIPNNNNALPPSKLIPTATGESHSQLPHSNRRFPLIPPQSSLTLTPPISMHGSDEPNSANTSSSCSQGKKRKVTSEDQPIDLSSKGTTNSDDMSPLVRVKNERLSDQSGSDLSDFDGDDMDRSDNRRLSIHSPKSDSDRSSISSSRKLNFIMKTDQRKSDYSDQENNDDNIFDGDDESDSQNHSLYMNRKRRTERRSSSVTSAQSLPKKMKVSTPLDLTRSTSASSIPPPPAKIAT